MPTLSVIVLLMNPVGVVSEKGGVECVWDEGRVKEEAKLFFAGPMLPANVL